MVKLIKAINYGNRKKSLALLKAALDSGGFLVQRFNNFL